RCRDQPRRSRKMVQVWVCEYLTSVVASITSATRASVHRSVGKPLARGPRRRAATTSASCSSESRGRRPARPAPVKAARPPSFQSWYHFDALSRETPSAWATSAWLLPRRNMSAARRRRALSASKSRRGGTRFFALLPLTASREPGIHPVSHIDVVTSMYFRKIINSDRGLDNRPCGDLHHHRSSGDSPRWQRGSLLSGLRRGRHQWGHSG